MRTAFPETQTETIFHAAETTFQLDHEKKCVNVSFLLAIFFDD